MALLYGAFVWRFCMALLCGRLTSLSGCFRPEQFVSGQYAEEQPQNEGKISGYSSDLELGCEGATGLLRTPLRSRSRSPRET
jgi:hypothetical protein